MILASYARSLGVEPGGQKVPSLAETVFLWESKWAFEIRVVGARALLRAGTRARLACRRGPGLWFWTAAQADGTVWSVMYPRT